MVKNAINIKQFFFYIVNSYDPHAQMLVMACYECS